MWHDDKSTLGFADGHAETHRWHDRSFIAWNLIAMRTPSLFALDAACGGTRGYRVHGRGIPLHGSKVMCIMGQRIGTHLGSRETIMERLSGLRRSDGITMLRLCLGFARRSEPSARVVAGGQAAVCQANLQQWQSVFQEIIQGNNGKFLSGASHMGTVALLGLLAGWCRIGSEIARGTVQQPRRRLSMRRWRPRRHWACSVRGVSLRDLEMHYNGKTYVMSPNGIAGSLGLNGYVLSIPATSQFEGGVAANSGWGI